MLATATHEMSDVRYAAIDAVHQATALYTTAHVVESILDRIGWPDKEGRLFDPSAGDGAFLTAALARIAVRPDTLADLDRIKGWELHPDAVAHSRERIAEHLIDRGWSAVKAFEGAMQAIEQRDFLTDAGDVGQFRFIAGNPPYLRYSRLPDYFKELYGRLLDRSVRGDLLHAFLDRCVHLMPADGYVAVVSSDRWLQADMAADLRRNMGLKAGISHLARLDPSTSFYRPKTRRKGSAPRVHPVEIVLRPTELASAAMTAAAISPDGYQTTPWDGAVLGDLFEIKLAPWLGPEGIFIVDQAKARELDGAHLLPIVDTDEFNHRTMKASPGGRYAVVTRLKEEPTGAVAEHLRKMIVSMPEGKRRPKWWMPPETINLATDKPGFVIPRISKNLHPHRVDAGVLPINHHLVITSGKSGLDLDKLEAILKSEETQNWLETTATRLDDGYYSIRARMLRSLPVHERFL